MSYFNALWTFGIVNLGIELLKPLHYFFFLRVVLMKRIYKKRKRHDIQKQALEQLKETRAQIAAQNPELLERMQALAEEKAVEAGIPLQTQALKTAQKLEDKRDGDIPIDRQKNLETILRFIELKPESDLLKRALKGLIQS